MKTHIQRCGLMGLILLLGLSTPVLAAWSSFEYRNSDGEYRYGIKNGNDEIKLNQKSRKKAARTAGKMNKIDKEVMATPDGQGDYRGGGPLPK